MSWKGLILLSGLLAGLSRGLVKDQIHRIGVFQLSFWQDLWSIMLIGLGWFYFGNSSVNDWRWGVVFMLFGLLLTISTGAFNAALREDMTGTTVLSYALSQIGIVLGATLLLGEWEYFSVNSAEGIENLLKLGLGLIGFLIYSGFDWKYKRWSKLMTLTVTVNIIANLITKYVLNMEVNPLFILFWQTVGMWIGDSLILSYRREPWWVNWKELGQACLSASLKIIGWGIYFYLIAREPISILSVLRRISLIVVSLLVAFVGFGEHKKLSWRQVVGLGLGLLAFVI